jgi:DNA-binding transcriptional regulator YiaG
MADRRQTRAVVSESRRLAGLTWKQLARVFGVARRSLHFWASGKPTDASNEEHLRRLLVVPRQADRGTAHENREMLLHDRHGASKSIRR